MERGDSPLAELPCTNSRHARTSTSCSVSLTVWCSYVFTRKCLVLTKPSEGQMYCLTSEGLPLPSPPSVGRKEPWPDRDKLEAG